MSSMTRVRVTSHLRLPFPLHYSQHSHPRPSSLMQDLPHPWHHHGCAPPSIPLEGHERGFK
ncbi:hypothetical protein BD414DRAFT_498848 [Trametes punicea]|nr:hypothetical protein BD414DRAFT_498848 [Trametes punicea]